MTSARSALVVCLLCESCAVLERAFIVEAGEVGVHVASQIDLDVIRVNIQLVGAEVTVAIYSQLGQPNKMTAHANELIVKVLRHSSDVCVHLSTIFS